MRATIKNYLDAAKQRREESGQAGFSLIELIVVVAILGILVAVAIPVFGSIQSNAKQTAIDSAAASGATVAAAEIANGNTVVADLNTALDGSETDEYTYVVTGFALDGADAFCVEASGQTGTGLAGVTGESGPGC